MTSAPTAVVSGLGLGLSLIVAIGAQNAFVLRQGLRREHVGVVVAVCAVSDAVLIVAGVAGTGALVERVPGVVTGIRVAGGLFLLGYAALAARRAVRPATLVAADRGAGAALPVVVATTLALTWLNPHVYLDTVLLLGGVATTQGDARWWFAGGAVAGSLLWFTALGYGARLLRPLFARPTAWRVLDGLIAVVMAALGTSLLLA
jgi:L-lysine exporter family protein LysE/ArgO